MDSQSHTWSESNNHSACCHRTIIVLMTPASEARTSTVTLSVSIWKIASSIFTASPSCFRIAEMVPSSMDSPIDGTLTEAASDGSVEICLGKVVHTRCHAQFPAFPLLASERSSDACEFKLVEASDIVKRTCPRLKASNRLDCFRAMKVCKSGVIYDSARVDKLG